MVYTRELPIRPRREQGNACPILNIRRVHLGTQHQAPAIDQDVALAAVDAFGAVVTTNTADDGRPDGLVIANASARLRIAPGRRTELLTQDRIQVLPDTIQTPQTEMVRGSLPGCEFVRNQPPSAATPKDVEDGVQNLASGVQARSADTLRWR